MRRIAFVATGLNLGGAEMMLYNVLSKLDRTEYRPCVLSLIGEGAVADRVRNLGVEVIPLGLKRMISAPVQLFRLLRALRRFDPDIVQCWMLHGNLFGGIAGRILGKRVIWSVHNVSYDRKIDKFHNKLAFHLCAALSWFVPEKVIYVSEASRREHLRLGFSRNNAVIIHNGVDAEKFRPDDEARASVRRSLQLDESKMLVGLVGHYHPYKDINTFLAAAGRVRAAGRRDVAFLLCGSGLSAGNAELLRRVQREGLEGSVFLLGERSDVHRIMAALDVFALSSLVECFPMVLCEAMACAVPCAATGVGDVRAMLRDGGRVVPPGDPEALAGAVAALLALEGGERKALGRAGRRWVGEHCDLLKIARAYGDLYTSAGVDPDV